MTRFLSPARSADGRPVPPVDGEPRPVPRVGLVAPWVACGIATLALFLLVFVLQNGRPTEVHFLGLQGRLPMGVALLLAAVVGALLVAVPAVARLVQSRLPARRQPVADPTARTESTGPTP